LDKIIYTGTTPKEEITQELNELLSRFIDELMDRKLNNEEEKTGVDKG